MTPDELMQLEGKDLDNAVGEIALGYVRMKQNQTVTLFPPCVAKPGGGWDFTDDPVTAGCMPRYHSSLDAVRPLVVATVEKVGVEKYAMAFALATSDRPRDMLMERALTALAEDHCRAILFCHEEGNHDGNSN